jgi:outer membrane protein assembly factor BamB
MRALWSFVLLALAASAQKPAPKSNGPARLLWQAEKHGCALSQPAIQDALVFLGACTGKFYALEKNTGKQEWAYDARSDGIQGGFLSAPVLHNGLVFAGTEGACNRESKGYIYAFDQHTGKVHWKAPAVVTSSNFVLLGTAIVFGIREGALSVDLETGRKKWDFTASTTPTSCGAKTSIATDGVNVYLLADNSTIYALEGVSGHELWKQNSPFRITTGLLIYKDVLYFGVPGQVKSLNIADGRQLGALKVPATPDGIFTWHRRGETDFEYSYGMTKTPGKSALLAYADEFEDVAWSHESSDLRTSDAPMPWKSVVVAGNCRGDIRAYGSAKGALAWKAQVDGCITGFAHDDSTLFIAVREGALYAFRPPAE